MILLSLFWELFKISLFIIGGGYAILAAADETFAKKGWTKSGELLDNLSVFQMIPGIIAAHTAVYVGRRVAGRLGAAVGVFAIALPSVLIFTAVSMGYRSLPLDNPYLLSAFVGLRSALTGVIAATIIRGWKKNFPDAFAYGLMVAALSALMLGIAVPYVLLAAMMIGLVATTVNLKPQHKKFKSPAWLSLLLFLKYGLLCFGGGYVLVPMYIEDFVGPTAAFLQIPPEEFGDLMALTQMTPGPIGVNGATFFGYRLAGVPGGLLASMALLLPGAVLAYLSFASLDRFQSNKWVRGLLRGARPASVALMIVALIAFAKMSIFENGSFNTIGLIIVIISMIMILKKKMSVVMLVLFSSFVASVLRADEGITRDTYPDADSVLVDSISRITYHPDGTSDMTDENWAKILTEKGRREESEISMRYSKRYGSAEILYVGAIDTNGVERVIDVSATTKDVTDNSSMAENIYDPMDRRIYSTIPGLKVGETVHVKTRHVTEKPRCEGVWSNLSVFEWSCPIIRSSLEITAPKDLPLKKIVTRHPLGNIVESTRTLDDGSIVHTFTATNSAQVFPEPDMPALFTEVQSVRVSTAADWPEISRWYWNLCQPHLAKTTPEMTNTVGELVQGLTTDTEKIRAIFKFVSQEIRYMGLTMEDTSPGYSPHDIDITFKNRYGVCRDKAALLVALLRIAGFEAYPVLIHVGEKLDPEVPRPFFNHAIVAVVDPSSPPSTSTYILMDPTNEKAKDLLPAYESDKSYLVCRPDGETLLTSHTPDAKHNELTVTSSGTLARDGSIILENEIRFNGINDTVYRDAFARQTPADRIKFFERAVKSLAPGAELIRCSVEPVDMLDTEKPIVVTLVSKLPESLLKGETSAELTVPFISRRLGMANYILGDNTSLEKRRFTLTLESTASTDETLEIDLGGAIGAVKNLPATLEIEGDYAYRRTFEIKNGKLIAHRRVAINALDFSPEAYSRLRDNMARTEAVERKRPVFYVNTQADADVRWLKDETEVDITGERAWTLTTRVEKKILTYEGKKSSAELTFGYNPVVETIQLVEAVVKNPDGSEARVTEKEMNEMDCGWAAKAPRYPAAKQLIVNLPSVNVGSTIAYTFVRSVTNAPSAYYGTYGFDSYSPLDRRVVRVNDWKREVLSPRRIPKEPGQPYAFLWRDQMTISSNTWAKAAKDLRVATEGLEVDALPTETNDIRTIRDWMAKQIRIVGPSLWELPIGYQLTAPATVIAEHYATRLDYMRTLVALLRVAGYEADVVFASNDADDPEEIKRRNQIEKPNVHAFTLPVCRVTVSEGGFLGFGATKTTYFLGTENEYTPLGVCGLAGCTYFDPVTETFGTVTLPDAVYRDLTTEEKAYVVREDGRVDLDVTTKIYGAGVGGFRKKFAEILPEDRNRLYQQLLGDIDQAATPTSELKTSSDETEGACSFSCYIPDYATVADDTISLQLPGMASSIPTFTGGTRQTPFAVSAAEAKVDTIRVTFPKGYTEIEHLPQGFVFANPQNPEETWLISTVETKIVDGALVVTLTRDVKPRVYSWYGPDCIELIKDRNRIANARANRTLVVRKAK